MRQPKLSKEERAIEKSLVNGEFVKVDRRTFEDIAQSVARRKKDAVLNVRVNSADLKSIKQKAKRMGVKYQTFISELIHHVAHS